MSKARDCLTQLLTAKCEVFRERDPDSALKTCCEWACSGYKNRGGNAVSKNRMVKHINVGKLGYFRPAIENEVVVCFTIDIM